MINYSYSINPYMYNSLFNHLCELQNKYSKLIAIRMDFSFMKNSNLWLSRRQDLIFREMEYLTHYLMQNDYIVAYQWVPEYTEDAGLHFHAVFYANGNRFRSPHQICDTAAMYWHYITQGDGKFFDCTLKESQYKRSYGILNYANANQYINLMYAISYLAKNEQKILDINYIPYLALSEVPAISRRGRPRSHITANLHKHYPSESTFYYNF